MFDSSMEAIDKKSSSSNSSFNIILSVATNFLKNTFISDQSLIPIIKDGQVEIQPLQQKTEKPCPFLINKESASSTMTRVAAARFHDEISKSSDSAAENQKQITKVTVIPESTTDSNSELAAVKSASFGKGKSLASEENIVSEMQDVANVVDSGANKTSSTTSALKSQSVETSTREDADVGVNSSNSSNSGFSTDFPATGGSNIAVKSNTVNKNNDHSVTNQETATSITNCHGAFTNSGSANTNRFSSNSTTGNSASFKNNSDTPPINELKKNKSEKKSKAKKFYVRISPYMDLTTNGFLYFGPMVRKVEAGNCVKIGRFTEKFKDAFNASSNSSAPIVFKSKVVSRSHALLGVNKDGEWFIKDVKSSAGTFLNRRRLSPANEESGQVEVKNGDVIQLGVDFRGGTEEIYRCVKMKIELNKSWVIHNKNFSEDARQKLQTLGDSESETECCVICLEDIKKNQAIFFSPCSHIYHYRCIRRIIYKTYPQFTCPTCRATNDLEADEDDDLATSSEEEADNDIDELGENTEEDLNNHDQQQLHEDAASIYEMDPVEDNIISVRPALTPNDGGRINEQRIVIDVDDDNDQIMT